MLNEFTNIVLKKIDYKEATEILEPIKCLCKIQELNLDTHNQAFKIAKDNKIKINDAMIIASAKQAKCDIIYSENFDKLGSFKNIKITNPFN